MKFCVVNCKRVYCYFIRFVLGICIYNLANYYKKLAVNCVTARDIYELKVYPKSSVLSFWFALHS